MATAIDPQPLLDDLKCNFCVIPPGLIQYAILAALVDVANGDPVPSDPQELIDEARCLECTIPPGLVPYAMLSAISNISGGGGGGAQEVYIGRDPLPPDDPTKPALSFPSGGGTLTQWDVGSASWV